MLKPRDVKTLTQDELNRVNVILTELCYRNDLDAYVYDQLLTALNIIDPEE
ncbi:hypothetical protein D3C76_169700 [compost metagenome]